MMNFLSVHFITQLGLTGSLVSVSLALSQTTLRSSEITASAMAPEAPTPKIRFANTNFHFGRVGSGETVKHDYVFTNVGSATLEILGVRTGCGCTTAGQWDRKVEPGKTGVIPLQFRSGGYGGEISKSTFVACNDPTQSNVVLHIKGTIWKPIDITPSMVLFNVSSELQTNQTKEVRIVNNLDDPVELSDLQCTNKSFQAKLETVQPGKEFKLHVTAVAPFESRTVTAPVTLKTSSPKMPTLSMRAYIMVQQPITVNPSFLRLPAGPLTNAVRSNVTIRNTGTNMLVLSEAKLSIPGAEINVRELQPGRLFLVTLQFPEGFDWKPEQQLAFSVKSNHPQFPLLRVPVMPAPPPVRVARQPSGRTLRTVPVRPVVR